MMFLEACNDYSFLSVISLIKEVIEIICIITPILLIVLCAVDVAKIVVDADQKNIQKCVKRVIGRTIAAVLVFFVPTFVSLLSESLETTSFSQTECWSNAEEGVIADLRAAKEQEEELAKEELEKEKSAAKRQREETEKLREAVRAKNEEEARKILATMNPRSGNASGLAAKMIQIAEQEIGAPDSPNKFTRAYGSIGGYGYAWCAAFTWWCSNEAGVYPAKVSMKSAGCNQYVSYFKNNNDGNRYEKSKAFGGNYTPKTGDYIFFNWNGNAGSADHVGMVKSCDGNKIYTIEGNTSDTVANREYDINSNHVIGFGVWE